MELLSPAGNLEKLETVFNYGADAAYLGIPQFSLRTGAESTQFTDANELLRIKGSKKVYGALNIFFHNDQIKRLEAQLERLSDFPIDALIISDLGALGVIKKHLPNMDLHLSTQANCTNYESAQMYYDLGFSRVVPGREMSLEEIAETKIRVPNLELEVFVHGAMCLAYSGRCFLSKWMCDRSANDGSCAHSCRWDYKVLEERERPGEYYPIEEYEDYTTIMSSKDISMIDYLSEMQSAGIDSLKIEGRMKSAYYAAIVTRAYRKELDRLANNNFDRDIEREFETIRTFKQELEQISHREYSTGFYLDKEGIQSPNLGDYTQSHRFAGRLGEKTAQNRFKLIVKNTIYTDTKLEIIGPNYPYFNLSSFTLYDNHGNPVNSAHHGKEHEIEIHFLAHESNEKLELLAQGDILRIPILPDNT